MMATPKMLKTESSMYEEDIAGMTEGSCYANRNCCERKLTVPFLAADKNKLWKLGVLCHLPRSFNICGLPVLSMYSSRRLALQPAGTSALTHELQKRYLVGNEWSSDIEFFFI